MRRQFKACAVLFASHWFAFSANAACDQLPQEPSAVIESHLESLEKQISAVPDAERQQLQQTALTELDKLQCLKESQSLIKAPDIKVPFVEIPVYFVTDRRPLTSPDLGNNFFGPDHLLPTGASYVYPRSVSMEGQCQLECSW